LKLQQLYLKLEEFASKKLVNAQHFLCTLGSQNNYDFVTMPNQLLLTFKFSHLVYTFIQSDL